MASPAIISIHVQPRAGKTETVGWYGDAIKIRLRSPPVDGAANEELVLFISQRLGIPRSAVSIVSGVTGRRKRLSLEGITRSQAIAALGLDTK